MAQSSIKTLKAQDHDVLLGVYAKADTIFSHGQGCQLFDTEGGEYLDFGSGIAVSALGHSHTAILEAIRSQSLQFIHISNLFVNKPQVDLAQALLKVTGHNGKSTFDKVFFCNSGTEANEALIKFARKYWSNQGLSQKFEIISFDNSFHGRSMGALSVTAQAKLSEGFGPSLPGAKWLPWNDVEALKAAVNENTAAILLEPIQAEGGLNSPSEAFVQALNEIALNGQALLMVDEIQCALGRLGTWLGSDSVGLKPDLVSLAKPIGGGLPLGAVLLKSKVAEALKPGDHGTTFGGNPVACAAGLAMIQEINKTGFLTQVHQNAAILHAGLEELHQRFGFIKAIKGLGHLRGLQLSIPVADVVSKLRAKGLIALRAGNDVLRLAPPLIVSEAEIEEALDIITDVFENWVEE